MAKPDTSTLLQPSVRVYRDWSPALVRAAEMQADAGDLRLAAELCDWLLADDRVRGALLQRVRSLLGCALAFEPGVGRNRKRAVKQLEAEEDFWTLFPEPELVRLLGWALLLGAAPADLAWAKDGDRVAGPVRPWHPSLARYDWQKRAWFLRIDGGREVALTPGDGKWVLLTPYGADRPWAEGLWRPLARWALLKKYAIQDWAATTELGSILSTEAAADAELTPEVKRGLLDDMNALGAAGRLVMPPGVKLAQLDIAGTGGGAFAAQLEAADRAIAVAILGQDMTSAGDGSTYAASKVGDGVRLDILKADASSFATELHEQVLAWWAEFNFGDAALAPWPTWQTDPPEDVKATGESLKALGDGLTALDAVLASAGLAVDVKELAKKFDLPVRELTADERRPAPAPSAPEAAPPGEPPGEAPPANEAPAAAPPRGAATRLAATDVPPGASAGQAYVDGLVAEGAGAGARALRPDVEALAKALDQATGYHDLLDRLAALYEGMAPDGLAAALEGRALLADLAGRAAVAEDL